MECPKCNAAMVKVTFAQIEVDRCTACKGLWFDAMEHEHLKDINGSEQIDVGQPSASGDDTRRKLKCPACHALMINMVDHEQPHIHYESCSVCYGVFFDAGEFKTSGRDEIGVLTEAMGRMKASLVQAMKMLEG